MSDATSIRPQVNGILETSLYVERPTQSVEFYRRVFGFDLIDSDQTEGITDETRLCAMRAGDRSVLLLFKKALQQTQTQVGRFTSPFPVRATSMGGMAFAAGDYD